MGSVRGDVLTIYFTVFKAISIESAGKSLKICGQTIMIPDLCTGAPIPLIAPTDHEQTSKAYGDEQRSASTLGVYVKEKKINEACHSSMRGYIWFNKQILSIYA